MQKNLLVPFDFSKQAYIDIEWAKFYAKKTGSKIYLLNVIEKSGFLSELIDSEIEEKLKKKAYEKLEIFAREFLQDFDYELIVEEGKVYEQIEETAEDIEPWAIIMGRDENPSLKKRLLGSNTLHVINETEYPVISIRGTNKPGNAQDKILVPLDFKKPFREQLTAAIEMSKLLKSKIIILTVNNDDSAAWKTEFLVRQNKTKKLLEEQGIDYDFVIEQGDIVEKILNYAEKQNPLLTIIMLRDEGILSDFFIGSVAKKIIEECPAPVMSIVPWDADEEKNPLFSAIYDPLGIFK